MANLIITAQSGARRSRRRQVADSVDELEDALGTAAVKVDVGNSAEPVLDIYERLGYTGKPGLITVEKIIREEPRELH